MADGRSLTRRREPGIGTPSSDLRGRPLPPPSTSYDFTYPCIPGQFWVFHPIGHDSIKEARCDDFAFGQGCSSHCTVLRTGAPTAAIGEGSA
jgi:hypothetical protein